MLRAWHARQAVLGEQRLWHCALTRQTFIPALSRPKRRCIRFTIVAGPVPQAVRHACHDDLDSMHRILQEGNIAWSLSQLEEELNLEFSTILVSVSKVQVDGFVCGWGVSGELQVMLLAVSHNRQRQGIGTALLEELLCIGKGLGHTSACLEVREGNEAAVRLYSRAGFIEVGRRRKYYDNGDAAILMSKTL